MSRAQKNRLAGDAAKRQTEAGKACGHSSVSASQCTTGAGGRQIAGLLGRGQTNAVPLRQLVTLTGRSGREVRRQIMRERRGGTPILSDNQSGYFLPGSEAETARFVRSMRRRAKEIIETAQAIENRDAAGR